MDKQPDQDWIFKTSRTAQVIMMLINANRINAHHMILKFLIMTKMKRFSYRQELLTSSSQYAAVQTFSWLIYHEQAQVKF